MFRCSKIFPKNMWPVHEVKVAAMHTRAWPLYPGISLINVAGDQTKTQFLPYEGILFFGLSL